MMGEVKRMVGKAQHRAMRIVRRGIVKVATAAGFVQVKAADGELFDGAELWQQFGMSSRPSAGSEMLLLLVDGSPDQAVAIAGTSRGDRPSGLSAGDAMLWGAKSGSDQAQIHAKADGNVDINCASGEFVHVGGSSGAELALLGETVKADMALFATEIGTIGAVLAAANLLTNITAGWLCTKAKGA